jgi:hypothetical protein
MITIRQFLTIAGRDRKTDRYSRDAREAGLVPSTLNRSYTYMHTNASMLNGIYLAGYKALPASE